MPCFLLSLALSRHSTRDSIPLENVDHFRPNRAAHSAPRVRSAHSKVHPHSLPALSAHRARSTVRAAPLHARFAPPDHSRPRRPAAVARIPSCLPRARRVKRGMHLNFRSASCCNCPFPVHSLGCSLIVMSSRKFAPSSGMYACTDCPAGSFAGMSGQSNCTSCPANSFTDRAGRAQCDACPSGSSATGTGMLSHQRRHCFHSRRFFHGLLYLGHSLVNRQYQLLAVPGRAARPRRRRGRLC